MQGLFESVRILKFNLDLILYLQSLRTRKMI